MAFDLNIKNLGKLADAKIRIGRFTVFAGPNNTGKSFVSKIVYSLFNAMNANHAEVHINNLTDSLFEDIELLSRWSEGSDALLSPLKDEADALYNLAVKSPVGNIEELDKIIPNLVQKANDMQTIFQENRPSIKLAEQEDADTLKGFEGNLAGELRNLEQSLRNLDALKFIANGIKHKIEENLIENFQVPSLSDLRGAEEISSQVDIKNFGIFKFSNGDIGFEIDHVLLDKSQQFSKVIYVESPVYWKLKNALEDLWLRPRYMLIRRGQLSGIPRYFYDLVSALKSEYTGNMAFQNVYERITGKDILGGKIVISDSGAFLFQENGRSFPLPVTAMGVANLGILALLIERKVLDQEAFLFIDEPEAHLHPAWQVVMAEALFDLAKGGAHVVIATHSVDILKWLEVHIKRHPEDEKLVALNKFPVDGDESVEQDFDDKLEDMKMELAQPFADLHIKGL